MLFVNVLNLVSAICRGISFASRVIHLVFKYWEAVDLFDLARQVQAVQVARIHFEVVLIIIYLPDVYGVDKPFFYVKVLRFLFHANVCIS